MKVLLINPTRTGQDSYISLPLHLVYIATSIVEECNQVEILDIHYQYVKHKNHFDSKADYEDKKINEILNKDFDILGIGSIVSAYDFSKRLVNAVRKSRPEIPVIVGGGMGIALKDLWLDRTDLQYMVESDGELAIKEFIKAHPDRDKIKKIPGLHVREGNIFVSNKPNLPLNLDFINYPRFDILKDLPDYMEIQKKWLNLTLPQDLQLSKDDRVLPVVLTRGCPFKCTFCYHVNNLHRKHSIEYILKYFKHLKDKYSINYLALWDELIIADKKWLAELCDKLTEKKYGIKIFASGGKPNFIDREAAKKMKLASMIRISYGIESGSQKMLDVMKKQTTVEENYRAVKISVEEGIFTHLNMIAGMPGENAKTLAETSNFLVSLAKEGLISSKNVSFSYATGYPGTELYNYMLKNGHVSDTEKYLLQQSGMIDYKYNICGMNKSLLYFMVDYSLLKVDLYFYLKKKEYSKLLKSLVRGIAKILKGFVMVALPYGLREKLMSTRRERRLLRK
jgi:radical SAM superfamily enzyme YgiQ (UPF0313 family)